MDCRGCFQEIRTQLINGFGKDTASAVPAAISRPFTSLRMANHGSGHHFFAQVFPLSALLQISWLLVEITTSAGPRTSM